MKRRGYIAAVLSERAAKRLRALARHPHVYCHHITMAYEPDDVTYQKYAHLFGKRIRFTAVAMYVNRRAQAVAVVGVPTKKARPHITVSCRNGVRPAYSNELLAQVCLAKPYLQHGFATVMFIPLDR